MKKRKKAEHHLIVDTQTMHPYLDLYDSGEVRLSIRDYLDAEEWESRPIYETEFVDVFAYEWGDSDNPDFIRALIAALEKQLAELREYLPYLESELEKEAKEESETK